MRLILAIWATKLARLALRLTRHNGTHIPGEIGLNICPDLIVKIAKPTTILAVTGTNGKTTSVNLAVDALRADGHKVLTNSFGSNTRKGLAAVLVQGVTWLGRSRFDMAVFEIDERSAKHIFQGFAPDWLLVTNLLRDSIPRNAHPEYIASFLNEAIPATTGLVLNADELISAGLAPANPRVYFGLRPLAGEAPAETNRIMDIQMCPTCRGELTWVYRRYHHIGRAICPSCGFASPDYDYAGQNLDRAASTIEVAEADGVGTYHVPNASVFNLYNLVAVVALLRQAGLDRTRLAAALSGLTLTESRFSVTPAGDHQIVLQLTKGLNAFAMTRGFDFVRSCPGDKELILMLSPQENHDKHTENVAWLYDADFEFLAEAGASRIVVAGQRRKDFVLRLAFAGLDPAIMVECPDEWQAASYHEAKPGRDVYLLYDNERVPEAMAVRAALTAQAGQP